MLPVRLKVLSSSSCSLSEASSLLQRFLSSDACSDSLARDYVANVAQALQDSLSRRAKTSGVTHSKHRHFPSSSQLSSPTTKVLVDGEQGAPSSGLTKLHRRKSFAGELNAGKQSNIAAGDNGEAAGSALIEAENVHKRHKRKRRHSAIENDTETVFASTQEAEESALMHHDKRRRKKEKSEVSTELFATENRTPDKQTRRSKEMTEREVDHIGVELLSPHDQKKRKKKEKYNRGSEEKDVDGGGHNAMDNVTPEFRNQHEKKKRKHRQEENSIEIATPVLYDQIGFEKKKRKKEKQGNDAENMKTPLVNGLGSPSTWVESLDKKSATKEKQKRDAGNVNASGIFEARVSDTPVSRMEDDKSGSSKRKKAKEYTGLFATPDNIVFSKVKQKIDAEALPVAAGSVDSEEKKRKKKKRKRKGEPESE